MVLLTSKTII